MKVTVLLAKNILALLGIIAAASLIGAKRNMVLEQQIQ